MMVNILVTGGAGFIGSHLISSLILDKYNIVCYDNLYSGSIDTIAHFLNKKKFVFIKGDIRDFKKIYISCKNVDVIIHLAAQSNVMASLSNPDYTFTSNILGTFNVMKAAAKNKVRKVIFASSREVYGDAKYLPVDESHPLNPKSMYGSSKVAAEMICRAFMNMYDIDVTIFRISNVYGAGDKNRVIPNFIESIKKHKPMFVYGGSQILDFVWIEDVTYVLRKAISNKKFSNETFNLGSGKGITIKALALLMKKIFMSNAPVKILKKRAIETERFVANIKKLRLKPKLLKEGLKMMKEEEFKYSK